MSETAIKDTILSWLRKHGSYAVKIHGGPMQEAGVPDIQACISGRFIAIEVKIPGQEATPVQQYHIEDILRAGGVAFVAHSLREAMDQLETFGVNTTFDNE
jgi:Holliday junction resolvase